MPKLLYTDQELLRQGFVVGTFLATVAMVLGGVIKGISREVWRREEKNKAEINKRTVQYNRANKLSLGLSKGKKFNSWTPRLLHFPSEGKSNCKLKVVLWQG